VKATLSTLRISAERGAPPEAELAGMYDEAAERWHDRLALLGYLRAYEDLFDRMLADRALNSLGEGGHVLDCGIGTGAFSLVPAGKVAATVRIEGVDMSPSMLLRACFDLDRAHRGPAAPARRELRPCL
jgi:ubiquinone/menaquinone biosynthesis C-methylase UbiE